MRRAHVIALALLFAACGDPLKKPQIVEEPRIVAGKSEVVSDPDRASPKVGETLRVSFWVVAPSADPAVSWAFDVCAARPTSDGRASCAAAPFAFPRQDQAAASLPSFETLVFDVGSARNLAVSGVCCVAGTPFAGSSSGCATGERLATELFVMLDRDGASNRNPSLERAEILFDGQPWPASSATACDGSIPAVTKASRHKIQIVPDVSDRETLPDGTRETLLVSHLSDSGELDRAQSVIEADAADTADVRVDWRSPGSATAGGEVGRFFLVIRDLRGGEDFAERRVCVTP